MITVAANFVGVPLGHRCALLFYYEKISTILFLLADKMNKIITVTELDDKFWKELKNISTRNNLKVGKDQKYCID